MTRLHLTTFRKPFHCLSQPSGEGGALMNTHFRNDETEEMTEDRTAK